MRGLFCTVILALNFSLLFGQPKLMLDPPLNKKALFSIIDNGPGISEEFHDKIFDMFYRVHESISGTGLGLYIVKESGDRLMGKVSLQSSLDKGAKFIVEIPNKLPK